MLELTIRLVLSLAVVVGLLMLLARFGAKKFRGSSDALVSVVHRQALSRTSAVSVVTVGNRILVLGTTEQQVSVLAELDPEDLDPETVAEASASTDPAGQFADALEEAQLQAGTAQPAAITAPAAPAAPVRPQARPASKAPAWDPNAALRTLPAVRAPQAPGATPGATPAATPAAATAAPDVRPSAAVDAILAAVDAHNARLAEPQPPALAILDDETASQPRRLTLAPNVPLEATGRLAGSVLSAQTWKQAFAAVTSRRAS